MSLPHHEPAWVSPLRAHQGLAQGASRRVDLFARATPSCSGKAWGLLYLLESCAVSSPRLEEFREYITAMRIPSRLYTYDFPATCVRTGEVGGDVLCSPETPQGNSASSTRSRKNLHRRTTQLHILSSRFNPSYILARDSARWPSSLTQVCRSATGCRASWRTHTLTVDSPSLSDRMAQALQQLHPCILRPLWLGSECPLMTLVLRGGYVTPWDCGTSAACLGVYMVEFSARCAAHTPNPILLHGIIQPLCD